MEFTDNKDIANSYYDTSQQVFIDISKIPPSVDFQSIPEILRIAELNGKLVNVFDTETIKTLDKKLTVQQHELQEKHAEHVEPASFCMRRSMCDYTGKLNDIYEVYLPFERLYGIMCCKDYVQNAVNDCITYCKRNHIYPIGNLSIFLAQHGFTMFKVLRTSGTIDDDWQIDTNEKATIGMATCDGRYVCGIYLATNVDSDEDFLHKPINVDKLCELNNISEDVKSELLIYLDEQLHDHYRKYII